MSERQVPDSVQGILDSSRSAEIECILKVSNILNIGLDKRCLALLVDMIEKGVHPEALADVIQELRSCRR